MKRCSTLLANREMQIKPIMRYLYSLTRVPIIQKTTDTKCGCGYENTGPSYISVENLKL